MDSKHLVVIGGGYAGILAALRASRKVPNIRVTLVSPSDVFVERIRLHEVASSGRPVTHSIRRLVGEKIRFHHAAAQHIDVKRSLLETTEGRVPFDALIVATGSRVRTNSVVGAAEFATAVEYDAMTQLRARLSPKTNSNRVLVCGGGLTAIECATALATNSGANVRLVTQGRLEPRLSEKGVDRLRAAIVKTGVSVQEHVTVKHLESGRAFTDNGIIEFDECVWACGMEAFPLGADSGFLVNDHKQIVIDAKQNPTTEGSSNIFVAGDAGAFATHPGHPVCMGCKTAMPMGAHAADNVALLLSGRRPEPFSFRDALYCISIGKSGLVQFVEKDGSAGNKVWQGWPAAMVKNTINRFTMWALLGEKRGISYRWPQAEKHLLAAESAV